MAPTLTLLESEGTAALWKGNLESETEEEFVLILGETPLSCLDEYKSQRAVENREKMEETGCEIICGAPTTPVVKG